MVLSSGPGDKLSRSFRGGTQVSSTGQSARALWTAVLNLLIAVVGPHIVEYPLWHYVHFALPGKGLVVVGDLVTCVTAFTLGYIVYMQSEAAVAKWLWLAGVCWFVPRALLMMDGTHGSFYELPGTPVVADPQNMANSIEFTLPFDPSAHLQRTR